MKSITITVPIDDAEAIQTDAESIGMTRTGFIKLAIKEKRESLERENHDKV
ncbi:MAG: hypothetical protein ACRC62_07915 [Microcoleus sp.]